MNRRELGRLAVAAALACRTGYAFAFDLTELMALLARQRSGEATFFEQRFVRGLDEPLVASGTLSFAAPDRFTRQTLKPRPELMRVEGDTITLTRGGRSRSFTLDTAPEMVAIVEAVRGTLTGNAQNLQRHFRPELGGSAEQWALELTPLDSRLADQVRSIRISGMRGDVRTVEMRLRDGDHSVMTIDPVRTAPGSAPRPPVSPASTS